MDMEIRSDSANIQYQANDIGLTKGRDDAHRQVEFPMATNDICRNAPHERADRGARGESRENIAVVLVRDTEVLLYAGRDE